MPPARELVKYEVLGTTMYWNGSLKTFGTFTKFRQEKVVKAIKELDSNAQTQVAKEVEKIKANSAIFLMTDTLKFTKKPPPKVPAEVSIMACVLAVKRKDSCAICLETMKDVKEMAVATTCKHVFCRSCIIQWTRKHPTCPKCRSSTSNVLIHLGKRDSDLALEILEGGESSATPGYSAPPDYTLKRRRVINLV